MTAPATRLDSLFARAPARPVPGCEALLAHQAADPFELWAAIERDRGEPAEVPYWCIVWPAARVLARFILTHPERVAGRTVLELACGGALPAIAAMRAGARTVHALDLDPTALAAARRNARANDGSIRLARADVARDRWPDADLILVADFFYRRADATRSSVRLARASKDGAEVWIADADRPFGPGLRGECLAEEIVPVPASVEGTTERRVRVQRFAPGTLAEPA